MYLRLSRLSWTTRLLAHRRLGDPRSFLVQSGWFESFRRSLPVDPAGKPIPWFTYAAILFLEGRLQQDMRVFEFGSGNSTRWWAAHVASLVSCEHDRSWYEKMKPALPPWVQYRLENVEDGSYARAVLETGTRFHIVVVDGTDRVNCGRHALDALLPEGVIVWDNSDREEYRPAYDLLLARGFLRLDFFGMGPINAAGWGTSIFYRRENCLKL
jgi:hypothetical protein